MPGVLAPARRLLEAVVEEAAAKPVRTQWQRQCGCLPELARTQSPLQPSHSGVSKMLQRTLQNRRCPCRMENAWEVEVEKKPRHHSFFPLSEDYQRS